MLRAVCTVLAIKITGSLVSLLWCSYVVRFVYFPIMFLLLYYFLLLCKLFGGLEISHSLY